MKPDVNASRGFLQPLSPFICYYLRERIHPWEILYWQAREVALKKQSLKYVCGIWGFFVGRLKKTWYYPNKFYPKKIGDGNYDFWMTFTISASFSHYNSVIYLQTFGIKQIYLSEFKQDLYQLVCVLQLAVGRDAAGLHQHRGYKTLAEFL